MDHQDHYSITCRRFTAYLYQSHPDSFAPTTMSSSVFFRFKSQKEPSRITFDGTGISVFELKREIITANRLGEGTDFELVISAEDSNEGKSQASEVLLW